MLMATREKNGVYLAPSDYDAMQEKMAAQADRIKESEQALRLREEELEEATQARGEIQTQLDISTEVLAKTEAELTQRYLLVYVENMRNGTSRRKKLFR